MTIESDTPDESLVESARSALSGDHRAYEELVCRHQEGVLANCRYISGSSDDAQDLAQEVFVKAFFAIRRFEGRSTFKTWIQRIKVNHCLNFLRKKKGKIFVDVDDPEIAPDQDLAVEASADRDVESLEQQEEIRAILESMPDTLRIPLILCDLDGYSYQEAADSLAIGLSAFKMRLKRARERFRAEYADNVSASRTGKGTS